MFKAYLVCPFFRTCFPVIKKSNWQSLRILCNYINFSKESLRLVHEVLVIRCDAHKGDVFIFVLHPGLLLVLRLCRRHTNPFLVVLKSLFFLILFRRLKKTLFFYPSPRIGNAATLTSSKRTQDRNTPCAIEARVVRQTSSGSFYLWAKCRCIRVPSKLCCALLSVRGVFRCCN